LTLPIPDTPQWEESVVLQWRHQLANGPSLFGSVEDNYVGTRIDEPMGLTATVLNINQILVHMPAYNIVRLRLGVSGESNTGAAWSATLFVNNLTNTQALVSASAPCDLRWLNMPSAPTSTGI
jgi:outer membrane receptor protein involved in Fe transport